MQALCKPFRFENKKGILVHLDEDPYTGLVGKVWFNYDLELFNEINEGDLVAIPSFKNKPTKNRGANNGNNSNKPILAYTIYQIIKKTPIHFAVNQIENMKTGAYPAFATEALQNASEDWTSQVNHPLEETTKIECEIIPTNLVFWEDQISDGCPEVEHSDALPMLGKEVYLLSYEFMEQIFNKGIDRNKNPQIGTLQYNKNVKVYMNIEALIRLHFGIFGFTGAGKSNLISTLVSKIMEKAPEGTKVVIFDTMGEYIPLLADQLLCYEDSKVLALDHKVFGDLNKDIDTLSEELAKTTLYPKGLAKYQDKFKEVFKTLLEQGKIKLLEFEDKEIQRKYDELKNLTFGELINECKIGIKNFNKLYKIPSLREIIPEDKTKKTNTSILNEEKNSQNLSKRIDEKLDLAKKLQSESCNIYKRYNKNSNEYKFYECLCEKLKILDKLKPQKNSHIISHQEFIEELNDSKKKGIYIIQASDMKTLREGVDKLASNLYENRRLKGKIEPLVSIIFDEADEYIPQDTSQKTKSEDSKKAIELLARRGRKYGLGIGIATQRIVYLDTNIMAQPHTYFVSKLPRQSDRQRVAEAFAISEDMFKQTFRFKKGDWLVLSHDATGLEGVPIPVHTENAEDRIKSFLENGLQCKEGNEN